MRNHSFYAIGYICQRGGVVLAGRGLAEDPGPQQFSLNGQLRPELVRSLDGAVALCIQQSVGIRDDSLLVVGNGTFCNTAVSKHQCGAYPEAILVALFDNARNGIMRSLAVEEVNALASG